MSFILEALRKSEAERRRGQAPDLLSEAMPVMPTALASADKRGRIVVVVAAALIAVLLVLWAMRPSAPEDSGAVAAVPAQAPAPVAAPPLSTPTRLSPPRRSVDPIPATPTTSPAPPATQATVAVATPPTTSGQTNEPRPVEPQIAAPPAPVAATASASTTAFASPDAPLSLADLSNEERQQLPALKISMHMWAPDAANRFAIIDGTRVNEGDRIGDATVEAIQQEGVMLSWRGRRIRLQIR
ncbi:general secretion pathway protein GspB [Lysobacter tyrosinilyticus]